MLKTIKREGSNFRRRAFAMLIVLALVFPLMSVSMPTVILADTPSETGELQWGGKISNDRLFWYQLNNTFPETVTVSIYMENKDGSLIMPAGGEVVIPDMIDGYVVTGIDARTNIRPQLRDAITKVVIPDSVETIKSETFAGFTNLTDVTFGSGLKSIESFAFDSTDLSNITFPDSLEVIGICAFYNCTSLTNVTFGSGLRLIGEEAFQDTSLMNVSVSDKVMMVDMPFPLATVITKSEDALITSDGEYSYELNGTIPETVTIERRLVPADSSGQIVIPDTINGFPVTEISELFTGYSANPSDVDIKESIKSVVIPDSVTTIAKGVGNDNNMYALGAFAYCFFLNNIDYGSGLKSIGSYAFCESGLENVTIPDNVEYIGFFAFGDMYNLKSISIGNGVTEIEAFAFINDYGSDNIIDLSIGNHVERIGVSAFQYLQCQEVIIPESVRVIDDFAFSESGLIDIYIPETVTSLGVGVFFRCNDLISATIDGELSVDDLSVLSECINLRYVKLGKNVTGITMEHFAGSDALVSISIPSNITMIDNDFFPNRSSIFTIFGEAGSSAETYAKSNNINFIVIGNDYLSLVVPETNNNKISVSGFSSSTHVKILVDGMDFGIYPTNGNHKYSADITFPMEGTFEVTVETLGLATDISESKEVYYNPFVPSLEEFNMYQSSYNMRSLLDMTPDALYNHNNNTYSIKLNIPTNCSVLETWIVVITDKGETHRISASYDPSSDRWIAKDPKQTYDHYGSKGILGVECKVEVDTLEHTYIIGYGEYRYVIDPAGYVYEAVPSNRLSGVTTTAYYDGSTIPDDQEDPVLWDAKYYDQVNPLITEADGSYAWDTPPGHWQVKYELSGYKTKYSDWMPVPPEQMEVNVGLVSEEAPKVVRVIGYPDAVEIEFSKYSKLSSLVSDNITVTMDGNNITGTIEFINEEKNYDEKTNPYAPQVDEADRTEYASIVRFIPDNGVKLAGDVEIFVDDVISYAGTAMASPYQKIISIKEEPTDITVQATEKLAFGETGNLFVKLEPAQAVAGMQVTVISDSPYAADVVGGITEYTLDENGEAEVPIQGTMTGLAQFTVTLKDTRIQATVDVEVDMPEPGQVQDGSNPSSFFSVTNITDVPTQTTAGVPLSLTGTVLPKNATNSEIIWNIVDAGMTGATLNGTILNTESGGTVKVKATIVHGQSAYSDYSKEFVITVQDEFVPVTNITDLPDTAVAGTSLNLTGTINPSNATNQNIKWSIVNAGATGATLDGNTLHTLSAGTIDMKATITNGKSESSDYTKDFTITVTKEFIPVSNITGIPTTASGTAISLNGTVLPESATNKKIIWSIADAGDTGAVMNGNTLTIESSGIVKVRATIVNGLSMTNNYVKEFVIQVNVSKPGGSTDPDPTKPTDPDPTNPTDPDPTKPTDPDPTKPTDPDPTKPSDPDPTNPTTYKVTVLGSYASESGEGSYEVGDKVTIKAGSRRNYRFDGWTVNGVTLADEDHATTTFIMPSHAVTVTANWERSNSSSSSGSTGGRGGSSSNPSSNSPVSRPVSEAQSGGTWVMDTNGWYYQNPDNSYPADSWQMIGEEWYFFDSTGYAQTGWVQDKDGSWYYMDKTDANMKTGWLFDPSYNSWYYLQDNGAMETGWIFDPSYDAWYYLDSTGALLENEITPDGYRVDEAGKWINN